MDKAAKPSGVFVCSVTHGYDRLSALLLTFGRQCKVRGSGAMLLWPCATVQAKEVP